MAAACLVMALEAQAARLALVVGNDNYQHATKLRNARNDATAIGRELESAGFVVTRVLDATRDGMDDALGNFLRRVQKGDEVVFFFSGHGSQPPNLGPHLLPVDIKPTDNRVIERNGQSLEKLTDELNQRARFSLIIIDACRDDPLRESATGRSIAPGSTLTRIEPPKGSLVIMAASKGQQALDRLGNNDPVPNGLFTRELIKHMRVKGLSAVEMLRKVRASVETTAEKVNHKQRPALMDESSSDFFFYPVGGGVPVAAPAPAPFEPPRATAPQGGGTPVSAPPPVTSPPPRVTAAPAAPIGGGAPSVADAQREFDTWEQALRANTRSAFETFLGQHPNGRYADRARARIAQFGAPAPAAAAPAPAPAPAAAPAAANNPAAEFALWDRAQSSNRRADYEAYLRQYPNGRYADRARAALPKAQ
ncbi:MAG: caspase family protein [Burkholderiales bacterium]|nr:caspase family protein [Burkholderiales bacterium]